MLEMYYVLLILWAVPAHCISLNGEWIGNVQLRNLSFTATVPGGIYTDLLNAKLIPENLFGFNDVENRWIAHQNVNYIKYFTVNDSTLHHQRISLIFHGLDTFATIYVNNKLIGDVSNMFIRYSFDVKEYLKAGQNKLNVSFESPIAVSNKLYNEQSKHYKIPPECVPPSYNGECHVNHIRKMQASYSWDWGPAFPSMGIWKDVEIVPSNLAKISDYSTYVREQNSTWQIEIIVHFDLLSKSPFSAELISTLKANNGKIFTNSSTLFLTVQNNKSSASILLEVPKNSVFLWWPNGHGHQYLYEMNLQIKMWNIVTNRNFKIGFRTVELIQEPVPKGLSFYFRINGLPIFAKGSNWIPSSIFPEQSSKEETIRHLLISSKLAHMNMLRVWGGGVYESDKFYELADEMGIMIWQDFMFACAMYPTTQDFLHSVEEEINQNTRRLTHHPSIVLWAGNNENEAALYGDWYGTGKAEIYKTDYLKLYVNIIENLMKKIDQTRPFIVSSPSNGLFADENGRFLINPQSTLYGDVHYYNYLENGWNINQYPTARFSSEYGFQSLPFYSTLKDVASKPGDLISSSEFMNHRQHLPAGNFFLKKAINDNFDIPQSDCDNYDFENYIYLSQINQAVSIKTESEHYRHMMSGFNSLGEGGTMGALYWQLNDVWQAPSWSSIDYSGRWKMLHYYAVDFFAPIIISPRLSVAHELKIYVISDLPDDIDDARIEIKIYKWNSFDPVFIKHITNVTIAKRESKVVTSFWLDNFLRTNTNCGDLKTAKKNCLVELELKSKSNQRIAPLNYVYASDFKNLTLRKENFEVLIDMVNCNEFNLDVHSDTLSLFVWLDTGKIKGRFSENGFHMTENKKKLSFYTEQPRTSQDIAVNLKIKSLYNIYINSTPTIYIRSSYEYCKNV